MPVKQDILKGYCYCGCGQMTKLAKQTRTNRKHIKGEPFRYIFGHRRPHSEETKARIRASVLANPNPNPGRKPGFHLTDEQKLRLSLVWKGFWANGKFENRKKADPALRKPLPWKGKSLPMETKIKLSIALSGENNPNWQGGKSCEPYCLNWTTEFKDFIKERDGYKCQNIHCSKIYSIMYVHHVDYDKKNCEPDNLITLCISCNSRANFNRNYWQQLYQSIINNSYGYQYVS